MKIGISSKMKVLFVKLDSIDVKSIFGYLSGFRAFYFYLERAENSFSNNLLLFASGGAHYCRIHLCQGAYS